MVLEYLAATALEKYINNGNENMSNDDLLNNMGVVGTVISIMISLATAYLAYECNRKSNPLIKWISVLIGFLFSGVYLIYYLFAHVVFGNQCKTRKFNIGGLMKGRRKVVRKKKKKGKRR